MLILYTKLFAYWYEWAVNDKLTDSVYSTESDPGVLEARTLISSESKISRPYKRRVDRMDDVHVS